MLVVSFPLAGLVIWNIKETSYTEEKTIFIDESHAAAVEQEFHTGKLAVVGHDGSSAEYENEKTAAVDEKVPVEEA